MRLLLVLMLVCGGELAWAKTTKIPKGTIDVNQLHEELLERFPQWKGTLQADGFFKEPLLGVKSTKDEITLTVPDEADGASVQAVVTSHRPKPKKDVKALRKSAKDKLQRLGLTQDEVNALVNE